MKSHKEKSITLEKDPGFYQSLIETVKIIVLILDHEGKILYFNPYLEEITGWKLEEKRGRDWFSSFLPECDYDKIRGIFQNTVHDIDTTSTINPILAKDGQERLIEWANKTLKDSQGDIIGVLSTGTDISIQARTVEELKKR